MNYYCLSVSMQSYSGGGGGGGLSDIHSKFMLDYPSAWLGYESAL